MASKDWIKYMIEKQKGTTSKAAALAEGHEEGFNAAMESKNVVDCDAILEEVKSNKWNEANKIMKKARAVSETILKQKTKDERNEAMLKTREIAREAGRKAAWIIGWERGWKKGWNEKSNSN